MLRAHSLKKREKKINKTTTTTATTTKTQLTISEMLGLPWRSLSCHPETSNDIVYTDASLGFCRVMLRADPLGANRRKGLRTALRVSD